MGILGCTRVYNGYTWVYNGYTWVYKGYTKGIHGINKGYTRVYKGYRRIYRVFSGHYKWSYLKYLPSMLRHFRLFSAQSIYTSYNLHDVLSASLKLTLFIRKSGNDRCHLPVGTVLLSVRLYSYFFSFVRFKYLSSLGISTLLTFVAIFGYATSLYSLHIKLSLGHILLKIIYLFQKG